MPTTLPTLSKTIDNAFTNLLIEVKKEVSDNILNSTVVWAWLNMMGCFKAQQGGDTITRTIRYAVGPTTVAVGKGDTMEAAEVETRTAARWNYERAMAVAISRSQFDDVKFTGELAIRNYVAERMQEALDDMKQKMEADVTRAAVTAETGKEIQGLGDMIPNPTNRTLGTYGAINRPLTYSTDTPATGNTWYSPRYYQFSGDPTITLLDDMKHFYNVVNNQQNDPADGILTSQTLIELYESFGLDAIQYINNQKMMDLGFTTLKFKGADMFYSPNMANGAVNYLGGTPEWAGLTHAMLFLNSKYIECVYNPQMWFEMTEWKPIYNQVERVAQILSRVTLVCSQLRRHGLLYAS